MKYPNVRVIFDRRHTAGSVSKGYVEVEVCFDRRRKYFSTGVAVMARNWSGRGVVGVEDAPLLNARIEAVRRPVVSYIAELAAAGKAFSFEGLSAVVGRSRREGGSPSFLEYVERRIVERTDIRDSTKRSHRKLLGWLRGFGRIVTFSDLTRANVIAFDEWLHGQGYKQWTVRDAHKMMKIYINDAVRHDVFDGDPYRGVKVAMPKQADRRFLRPEELERIRAAELRSDRLERVRDVFLFQCNTGLAYADLARFRFEDVKVVSGRYVYEGRRQKSGECYIISLLPEALRVLEKYGWCLPVLSGQKYNDYLKLLAVAAGLDIVLTSHVARHTFAVMCLNNGVPIEALARMMGHSDVKTTQIYAKIMAETVVDAFDALAARLEGL